MFSDNIFLRVLRDYKIFLGTAKFYFTIIFGIFVSIIVAIEPLFFAQIINSIEQFFRDEDIAYYDVAGKTLLWIGFIIFSIIIFYIYRYYTADKNILKFYVHILKKYSKHALTITYGSYLGKKQGGTFKKLERGRGYSVEFLFFFYFEFIKIFFSVIIIIGIMFFMHIKMAILTLILLPIAIFIGLFFNKKTITLQKQNNKDEDKVFGLLSDGVTNLGLLKSLSLHDYIEKQFNATLDRLLLRQYSISKRWSISYLYISVIVMFSRVIVLLGGLYFIEKGEISLAELFIFFAYIGWIYYPLGNLFGQLKNIQEWYNGIERLYQEFEDTIELEQLEGGRILKDTAGEIQFRDVSFGYYREKTILKDISFSIKKGQTLALVGHTGSGKSTIVNILLRFWDIKQGNILLDGQDIREIQKTSLRKTIGIVSQDNSLFNLSIRENLLFVKEDATKQELIDALKNAQADFVFDLKEGIDTVIGERGLKLSGGEKQRISIARLFLKNPQILILDEATSALDVATEKKIDTALKKLMKGKTSIIIAHRLSTIRHADTICVLEKGKIVETGTYEELMKKEGNFCELANPDRLILG